MQIQELGSASGTYNLPVEQQVNNSSSALAGKGSPEELWG